MDPENRSLNTIGIGDRIQFARTLTTADEAAISRKVRSYYEVARTVVAKIDYLNEEKKLILIADDEPLMFKLIEEFLLETDIHHDIITAPNGRKALELAEQLMPDLIITDWIMPDLEGLDFIRKLKQNPVTRLIPVILATGVQASKEQLDCFLDAGVIDYIKKPIDYSELTARVKTALLIDDSIKETKMLRESAERRDQFLTHLVDAAPIALFYLDINGNFLGCNARFEILFRVSKSSLLFQPYEKFLPNHIADMIEVHFSMLATGCTTAEFEVQMPPQEIQQRQLIISLSKFGEDAQALVVGIVTDVTKAIMVISNKEKELTTSNLELLADLEIKQRELAMHTQLLIHAKNAKEGLLTGVNKLQPYLNLEGKAKLHGLVKQLQRQLDDEAMLIVEKKFDEIHACLYTILEKNCPDITKNEKRLCAYLMMNHSAADIAKITHRSLNSINVGFARLRTKLKLPSNKNLRTFLNELNVPLQQPAESLFANLLPQ